MFIGGIPLEGGVHRGILGFIGEVFFWRVGFIGGILLESRVHKEAIKKEVRVFF